LSSDLFVELTSQRVGDGGGGICLRRIGVATRRHRLCSRVSCSLLCISERGKGRKELNSERLIGKASKASKARQGKE
jgi:hypothetical protein